MYICIFLHFFLFLFSPPPPCPLSCLFAVFPYIYRRQREYAIFPICVISLYIPPYTTIFISSSTFAQKLA
nr:MAG TPA: hypothetical protein [Caudoviricetes sp.]